MNQLRGLFLAAVVAAALAACGGAAKSPAADTTTTMTASESPCTKMATHLTGELVTASSGALERHRDLVTRILATRCEDDQWSDEAVACLGTQTGTMLETCEGKLTAEQEQALDAHVDRELGPLLDDTEDAEGAMGGSSPPPPPPPPDDPCGGGA